MSLPLRLLAYFLVELLPPWPYFCSNSYREDLLAGARMHAHGGCNYLTTFDQIGPVTAFHLAKNVGLDVVKPDRHLVRMTVATGSLTPEDMCSAIAEITGDKLSVVDVVLWRYATLEMRYDCFDRRTV